MGLGLVFALGTGYSDEVGSVFLERRGIPTSPRPVNSLPEPLIFSLEEEKKETTPAQGETTSSPKEESESTLPPPAPKRTQGGSPWHERWNPFSKKDTKEEATPPPPPIETEARPLSIEDRRALSDLQELKDDEMGSTPDLPLKAPPKASGNASLSNPLAPLAAWWKRSTASKEDTKKDAEKASVPEQQKKSEVSFLKRFLTLDLFRDEDLFIITVPPADHDPRAEEAPSPTEEPESSPAPVSDTTQASPETPAPSETIEGPPPVQETFVQGSTPDEPAQGSEAVAPEVSEPHHRFGRRGALV